MESLSFEPISTSIEQQLSSRILFYVNENYKNDISLGSIAAYFGYNPSYISRYFRSCFNVGLNQYITLVRLKYAIILMTESQNSVTYCAFESGFNSMRTFYRAFYNEFKCTPKEYLGNIERKQNG
jgi:AraC-like DNA-binding protein